MTGAQVDDTFSNGRPSHNQHRWPSLEADLDRFPNSPAPTRPARVAIASYEFNGIVRNGGIGTACTSLAKALAEEGHEVDLFFTGWADDPSEEAFERWERHYARLGASLHWLNLESMAQRFDAHLFSAAHSYALYEQLKQHDAQKPYDVIHFVESIGHGYYSLLAQHMGIAFRDATSVVGVHSPRRWMSEAHGQVFDSPFDIGDEFLERRSIELADVVVSPSAHMLDWLTKRGFSLPRRSYVQQYVTAFDDVGDTQRDVGDHPPIDELVFFGRLEQRKGLFQFCDALDILQRQRRSIKRVTFMGKEVLINGMTSQDVIARRASNWPWSWRIVSDFDRDDALDYLCQPKRLAVMASPIDNSPNTAYEAIGLGIDFVASRGGGLGELIHADDRDMFTYDPRDPALREIDPGDPSRTRAASSGVNLAESLSRAFDEVRTRARYAVPPSVNRKIHLDWHRAVVTAAVNGPQRDRGARPSDGLQPEPPIVVRTSELSLVDAIPADDDPLIVVLDDHAHPDPGLVGRLVSVIDGGSKERAVTCLGRIEGEYPDTVDSRMFLPTGGPAAFGVIANCFGAGVVMTKRSTLWRTGLWEADRQTGVRVQDLLATLALGGTQIDVVPEALYEVPATAASWGSLGSWSDASEAARPYCLNYDQQTTDLALIASHCARESYFLRTQLAGAEARIAEHSHALAVVTGSRSWRMTSWMRRVAASMRVRRD